jgi:hypothetical protein
MMPGSLSFLFACGSAVTAPARLLACGSMVLSDYVVSHFALAERKMRNQKKIKYHSAEG